MSYMKSFGLAILFFACSPSSNNKVNQQKAMENPYPFEIMNNDGQLSITAALESEQLFKTYYSFFEKLGYEGNGYCWEGHIIQILEKLDKELLDHIDFYPEAGAFYAYSDSEEAQMKFIKILSPIFSDLEKLEEFVKSADRSRVDD